MKTNKTLYAATCSIFLGIASFSANAQDNIPHSDNTTVNIRDRNSNEQTADQAGNNASDLHIMQNIRKAVMADDSLSTYGQNVKIIAENGKVTLKGPVHSEAERKNIKSKAIEIAGKNNVTDELSIKR
jgi:hyperosmotically inducible periplasmic protein